MAVNLSPLGGAGAQFFDSNGIILSGGKIYTYAAGTTTPQATYTSASGATPHANPIVLDSAGRVPGGEIWLTDGLGYKFVIETSTAILLGTYDNLVGINTPQVAASVTLTPSGYTTATNVQTAFDNLGSSAGTSKVGFIAASGSAISRTAQDKLRETVSIADFGGVGDGSTNNDAAFAAARAYLAAQTICPTLVFPAGVYVYSVSPDWGIQWIRMLAQGEVRFRYTGTGNAFIVTDDSYVQMMGLSFFTEEAPLIIEAPATAQNGVLWRSVHHSVGCFVVRGCGATYAGLKIEFAVCSTFPSYRCSFNENASGTQDWYLGAKPKYGLYLDKRNSSESAAYCMFLNPIIEGTEIGIYGVYALGCNFIGGTSEGCTDKGVWLLGTSEYNKFIGVDFESNTIADVLCQGRNNSFINCDSGFPFGETAFDGVNGIQNTISGGNYQTVTFTNNAINNTVRDIVYNRYDATGTGVIVNGVFQAIYNIYNGKTGIRHNQVPYSTVITVGASPFDYTNFTPQPVTLIVSGGTVSSVVVGNGSGSALNAGIQGQFTIVPNGTATITYTVTPTVVVLSV